MKNHSKQIAEKAEKYIRQNAVYYGNDQYRLSMKDWLYFIEGAISEVSQTAEKRGEERERERILGEIEKLVDPYEYRGSISPQQAKEQTVTFIKNIIGLVALKPTSEGER